MKVRLPHILAVGLSIVLTSFFSACSTDGEKKQSDNLEIKTHVDSSSVELEKALIKEYGVYSNKKVEDLTAGILKNIIASNSSLQKHSNMKITLLKTDQWICVSGLNREIYLSVGAIKSTLYENELAYLIAIAATLADSGLVNKRLERSLEEDSSSGLQILPTMLPAIREDIMKKSWFDKGGIYDLGIEESLNIDRIAVQYLMEAKYEYRGASSYFRRLSTEVKLKNNYEAVWKVRPNLMERYENIKDAVAKLPPKRDLNVTSKEYDAIRKRLHASVANKR